MQQILTLVLFTNYRGSWGIEIGDFVAPFKLIQSGLELSHIFPKISDHCVSVFLRIVIDAFIDGRKPSLLICTEFSPGICTENLPIRAARNSALSPPGSGQTGQLSMQISIGIGSKFTVNQQLCKAVQEKLDEELEFGCKKVVKYTTK